MDNVVEENIFQLQAVKYYQFLWLTIWETLHVLGSRAEHFEHCDNIGICTIYNNLN